MHFLKASRCLSARRGLRPPPRSQPENRKRGDQTSLSKGIEVPVAPIAMKSLPSELQDEIERPAVGDRSKALFAVIARMLEKGLDDRTIENIIRAHPNGIGEKYADRDDLDRDIARVREKTATPSQDDKITSLVSEMNREYAAVDDNGKTVVVCRREDTELKRKYVVKASYPAFRDFHLNARTMVTDAASGQVKWLANADIWLTNPQRQTYKGGLRFLPGVQDGRSDVYNLWTGWGVDPQAGDWSKMKAHIKDILCSGIPEYFDYVMNWLARAVQKPSEAGEVALVLRGARGTGKGIFARAVGGLFGQHYLHLSHARHLTGNFNAHLRDACLVFADEAFYAGDKQHEGQLKRLVTEPTLMIEAKYANAVSVRNCLHLIVASNDDWVVPAGTDERRFLVLDVSSARQKDYEYFGSLEKELEDGGEAALLHELLHLDLSGFNVRDVPQTSGLLDQKLRSLRGFEAWWYEILADGGCPGILIDEVVAGEMFAGEQFDWVEPIRVDRDALYNHYLAFSKERISPRG
jgi:Mesyanzhinovviridae DNA primase